MDNTQRERIERVGREAIKQASLGALGVTVDATMFPAPTPEGKIACGWLILVSVKADLVGGVDAVPIVVPHPYVKDVTVEAECVKAWQKCRDAKDQRDRETMASASIPAGLVGKKL